MAPTGHGPRGAWCERSARHAEFLVLFGETPARGGARVDAPHPRPARHCPRIGRIRPDRPERSESDVRGDPASGRKTCHGLGSSLAHLAEVTAGREVVGLLGFSQGAAMGAIVATRLGHDLPRDEATIARIVAFAAEHGSPRPG